MKAPPDASPAPAGAYPPVPRPVVYEPPDAPRRPRFEVDYDDGWVLRAVEEERSRFPFLLKVDFIDQARYTGFDRSVASWTDSTGRTRAVLNQSVFENNRAWFQFEGYALDPRLQYNFTIFTSTANNSALFLGWPNFVFSEALDLHVGYWRVPGPREWNESFRYTLGADRTMATTFFRPSFSPGIWAEGVLPGRVHYILGGFNSFDPTDQNAFRLGTDLAFATSVWWEPMGRFGVGVSDLEHHDEPAVRLGSSFVTSREQNQSPASASRTAPSSTNPEQTIVRLSDGTPLLLPGALAPNMTVNEFNIDLWTLDAGLKYRGLGLSGEFFARWIDGFRANGKLPVGGLFDAGGYAQGGYFVYRDRFELFTRASWVAGA